MSYPVVVHAEEIYADIPDPFPARKNTAPPAVYSARELTLHMPAVRAPDLLPQGFRLESTEIKTLYHRPWAHLRYGDGLNGVSVFESTSAVPWRPPAGVEHFTLAGRAAWFALVQEQNILGWTDGPLHGLVMGAVSRDTLTRLAERLTSERPARP